MPASPSTFVWYELMTTDLAAAEAFYRGVIGWNAETIEGTCPYTLVGPGEARIAGMMTLPDEVKAMGVPPCWTGYIGVANVDDAAAALAQAGGRIRRPADDIPGIGRFAVVADPQGGVFILFTPTGGERPPADCRSPGFVGWHELNTTDWEHAFDFYAGQFGWTKADAIDMGPMGTYQLFAAGGTAIGGMMNAAPGAPAPCWLFYVNVPAADAAVARVTELGGEVLFGPQPVPGGSWILNCRDPQGAAFALVAPQR